MVVMIYLGLLARAYKQYTITNTVCQKNQPVRSRISLFQVRSQIYHHGASLLAFHRHGDRTTGQRHGPRGSFGNSRGFPTRGRPQDLHTTLVQETCGAVPVHLWEHSRLGVGRVSDSSASLTAVAQNILQNPFKIPKRIAEEKWLRIVGRTEKLINEDSYHLGSQVIVSTHASPIVPKGSPIKVK